MARRKKNRTKEQERVNISRPGKDKAGENSTAQDIAAPAASQDARPSEGENRHAGRMVGLSTCAAGMFLALVFGMYLGSLAPDLLKDSASGSPGGSAANSTENSLPDVDAATADAAPKPQGDAADATAAPDMPPALARRLAELESHAAHNANDAAFWTELGNLYFDSRQTDKAIRAYEQSLAIAPANADVLTDLGIMQREKGEFSKAVECFRKAYGINPRHENALYNEGVVLSTDMGDKQQAAAAWKKLLEINPAARAPDGRPLSEMIRSLGH